MSQTKEIIVSSILMLLIDGVYLSYFKNYFNSVFNKIQGSNIKINYIGLIVCYITLIFGINYFVISKRESLLFAFLLGFTIYTVYETTNYATLKKWPFKMVLIDSIWGGTLFLLTTFLTYKVLNIKY